MEDDEGEDDVEEIDITDLIADWKNLDLTIFEAYKNMPDDFKNNLSFKDYYEYHRRKAEDILKTNLYEEEDLEETQDLPIDIPEEIESSNAEELAKSLIDFIKKEFPDDENVFIRSISQLFWNSKNLRKWDMPPEIQLKIEKAEMLAQRIIDKEKEVIKKEKIEKEKNELPSLIESCINWAKSRGLKKVTLIDIDAFLSEKNTKLLQQTKRTLYSMVNSDIKLR